MMSVMISIRGRWKGPLKVEPLVLGMVGSAFRYPPCYAVMLLVIALYLFFNVNCVYLVVIGAVCGLLIAEFYERKGDKKHDGAA